jgi:uncharacterized membrane protein YphA (DoxX/SURF4 family)
MAVSVAGLAVSNLSYGNFAPIWQPFPAWIPWREAWVYGAGVVMLIASAGLLMVRAARPSLVAIALYQCLWIASLAATVIGEPLRIECWNVVAEALAPLLGAWILCSLLRRQSDSDRLPFYATENALNAARIIFGLACITYGFTHFAYAAFTAAMVPSWLPGRLEFAYLTGMGHIAAGLGIALGVVPRLAATLEAIMMSLFGLLVWLPSVFAQPSPEWASTRRIQWSGLLVTFLLAASAWTVARSLERRNSVTTGLTGLGSGPTNNSLFEVSRPPARVAKNRRDSVGPRDIFD